MISEVVMPQMGADMKEGTILKWIKNEGDEVSRGEIIAEIETDKANVEIDAFDSGVFRKAVHAEGEVVPIGTVIAVIASPDEDISKYNAGAPPSEAPPSEAPPREAQPQAPAAAQPAPAPEAPPTPAPAPAAAPGGRLRASPVARRVAEEMGVDIATVKGSGPDGRILRRDVEAAQVAAPAARPAAVPPPPPAAAAAPFRAAPLGEDVVQDVQLNRIRQATARRTQESKQQAPHYYLGVEIDMTEAAALRVSLNKSLGEEGRLTINDIVVLATAKALVQHPRFNAFWVQDHLQLHSRVNIGIAVALDDGLVAPAVIDCANKGLFQISREARDVAGRARSGNLRPEEYTAATFNVSNIGGYGIEEIVPIITPPQVGVLGVGTAKEKPVVRNGEVVVRSMMMVYLAADHRATDGAEGARFLDSLRRLLESPGLMLL